MSDFFWASDLERLFEDLVFHRLAPEEPLEIANAFLQVADARGADDVFIGMNGGVTTFQHAALPGEELRGRDAGLARHE